MASDNVYIFSTWDHLNALSYNRFLMSCKILKGRQVQCLVCQEERALFNFLDFILFKMLNHYELILLPLLLWNVGLIMCLALGLIASSNVPLNSQH